ncbi:MAG: hypothetical protein J6X81_06380 [Muribaculaceae bacterium]|nr:hypothetical protein [Muribaculaceae bacterium]
MKKCLLLLVAIVTSLSAGAQNTVTTVTSSEQITKTSAVYVGEVVVEGQSVIKYLYSGDITIKDYVLVFLREGLNGMADGDYAALLNGHEFDYSIEPTQNGFAICSNPDLEASMDANWSSAQYVGTLYYPNKTVTTEINSNLYDLDNGFKAVLDAQEQQGIENIDNPVAAEKRIISHINSGTSTNVYYTIEDGQVVRHSDITVIFDCEATTVIYTKVELETAGGIAQDTDGYYLIGSAADWDEFAAIVHDSNAFANARMIDDVDLGDDQTMLGYLNTGEGERDKAFRGIFDGQGHTLTVAYTDHGSNQYSTPINSIDGATIKNLHIAGSWVNGLTHAAFVANSWGTSCIEKVWNSADITSDGMSWGETAAFVGCMKGGNLTIKDCHFSGTVLGKKSYNGCFVGYIDNGTTNIVNCLSTGTFTYYGSNNAFRGNHTNCYVKQFPVTIPETMQCTDEQLADGTIATALQDGRDEDVWVQVDNPRRPMLLIFADVILGDIDGNRKIEVNDVVLLAEIAMGGDMGNVEFSIADIDENGLIEVNDVVLLAGMVMGS